MYSVGISSSWANKRIRRFDIKLTGESAVKNAAAIAGAMPSAYIGR
jgi:hypothetical protein